MKFNSLLKWKNTNRVLLCVFFGWMCFFGSIPTTRAAGDLPRYEPSECPIEVPNERTIACGNLITYEDYDHPESGTIRTAIVTIRSDTPNPGKEALLFTEGGPGYSSLRFVWWLVETEFAHDRDIIILEQRGNLYSDPSLTCDYSTWWNELDGQTTCLNNLRQRGIDPIYYTTTSIAADIQVLMQVMDYESWDLFGSSYSTRVMQQVLRENPQGIRSAVLHSISPLADTRYLHDPEHAARVLGVLFEDCTADPACSKAYPDLEDKFNDLVRKLNREPVEFEMTFSDSSERVNLEVSGDTLIGWMVGSAFYAPAFPPFETAFLPLLIDRLSAGETDLLYPWVKQGITHWKDDNFSWGLYFSISCQGEAPLIQPEMIATQVDAYPELDGYYRHDTEVKICAAWDLPPEPDLVAEPVTSSVPVLALGGSYDPITPPEWSQQALTNMSNSIFVEFASLGHSVVGNSPCAEHIVAQFLEDPDGILDLSCLGVEPTPQFILPGEIIIAPAVYEIHYNELGYSKLEENLFLSSWVILMLSGLIALLAGVVKAVRRSQNKQPQSPAEVATSAAQPILCILAATALFWGYALRASLQVTAAATPNILRFGLPVSYWWLFALVLLMGILTIALVIIAALVWWHKHGSLPGRIGLTLAVLNAIVFNSVLANWGLFTALFR